MDLTKHFAGAVERLTASEYYGGPEDIDNAMHEQAKKARELEAAYLAGDDRRASELMIEVITLQGRLEQAVQVMQSIIFCRRSAIGDLPFE